MFVCCIEVTVYSVYGHNNFDTCGFAARESSMYPSAIPDERHFKMPF